MIFTLRSGIRAGRRGLRHTAARAGCGPARHGEVSLLSKPSDEQPCMSSTATNAFFEQFPLSLWVCEPDKSTRVGCNRDACLRPGPLRLAAVQSALGQAAQVLPS